MTIDVMSLYTNIPNDDGICTSLLALEKYRPGNSKPKNLTIIKLLEMVLKKNNFLLVGGTAIGNKEARSFVVN